MTAAGGPGLRSEASAPVPATAPVPREISARPPRGTARLVRLHVASRRVWAAVFAITASAIGLRIALIGNWDTYGALQLPLLFEAAAAAAIAVTTGSPLGEPERVAGRRLPYVRFAVALALTIAAVGALAAAGTGAHLAGGALDVARNTAGLVGLGLLSARLLGGGLAWVGPTGYLIVGVYGLYTQWHGPALTTPWIWPARPPDDLGASICAGLVFVCGMAVITVRGARDVIDSS
jgi:hypothetical protein